jgi:MFS family permease
LERVADDNAVRETTSMGKVAFASFIGTAIEFYDFYIYGTAAALVLGGAFFPEFSDTAGTLAAFATFAVAFFARPVGGVFGGAFAPLIAGQLLASSGGSWSISLYVLAMAAVSFVCISLLSETYLTNLSEIRTEERRLVAEARESAAG